MTTPTRGPTPDELAAMPWWRRLAALRYVTRSGCWTDAEMLCHVAAERVEDAAMALHRLGGRCYRRAAAAREAREGKP